MLVVLVVSVVLVVVIVLVVVVVLVVGYLPVWMTTTPSLGYADIRTLSLTLHCGRNEIQVDCPSKCGQNCPTNSTSDSMCKTEPNCAKPECQCIFNHRRSENGTCIRTENCPSFNCSCKNEVYDPCPSYCSEDCSQATPDGNCPVFGFLLLVVDCSPACRCMKGHCRKDGVCVSFDHYLQEIASGSYAEQKISPSHLTDKS
ncbi:hypothetical protein K1T71_004653 [Dendrolimus kikuchii]|uniref:Uncharacterized protein n=1 Tax=Dendrolimus kikuchii TaxID=765133 RepID=A0ACC1D864_9NEOP|nr:hypothetical protein K1T71_004653 [Dendrolimus kikuchii]